MDYTLDNFARDVAFEINFGGDRFDRNDVSEHLHGIDAASLHLFRNRVRYYAEDFRPKRMYANDTFSGWMNRQLDAWLSDVRTAEDLKLDPKGIAFPVTGLREDRGKWFRLSDGTVAKCTHATVNVEWGPDRVAELNPVEVPVYDLVKEKADRLLDAYGKEVVRDYVWDVISFSEDNVPVFGGTQIELQRNCSKVGGRRVGSDGLYYIKQISSSSGTTLMNVRDMDPRLQEDYLLLIDRELEIREARSKGLAASASQEASQPERNVRLDSPVSVTDAVSGKKVSVDTVFLGADGDLWVGSSAKDAVSGSYRLDSLSSKEVDSVRRATKNTLDAILSKFPKVELNSGRKAIVKPGRKL